MLKKVQGFIEESVLFSPGDRVVVAVSGGADSVALLDILVALDAYRLDLIVAHLNHLLRGAEADGDEGFVRGLAEGYGLPLVVQREDVGEIARRKGQSLEEAGRIARYAFFDAVAAGRGARAVALGHHADDQAETVLMRLLRGAGGSGLGAMAAKTKDFYVRPLLGVTRREIEAYLRARDIAWREDSSNASPDFLRNRIRHELLPLLTGYNPAISERLVATAEALTADEEVLEAAVDAAFAELATPRPGRVVLSARGVSSRPRAIRSRLYRRAIAHAKGDLARIGFRHLRDIDLLLMSPRPHLSLTLPAGLSVEKSYGDICFTVAEEPPGPFPEEISINGPGEYSLPGGGVLAVEITRPPEEPGLAPASMAYFDPAQAPFPWRVRTFRPGDRLVPFGMSGRKKVKELFIEARVPRNTRRLVPLLFCGETLLWVGGLKRSGAACLSGRNNEAVRVELLDFDI
ncbi:MAG TPA: tRNA lysidine(34) synthetase TilS [Geobacteraceae bacterium]|nr:tRNA lysidine(34) synthetase TilS [Geobacteraceae bacterium]